MARFTQKQIDSFDDYDQIRRSRLNADEMGEIDKAARDELDALKAMQESLTQEVALFMAKEGIGIVELTKRLKTSTRQTSKIMKGEANVTLATLAEVAALMGKVPRIVFEEVKSKKKRKRA